MKKFVIITIFLLGGSCVFAQYSIQHPCNQNWFGNQRFVPMMNTGFMPGGCMPDYRTIPQYNSVGIRRGMGYYPGVCLNQSPPLYMPSNTNISLLSIIANLGLLSNGSLNQSPQLFTPTGNNQVNSTVIQNINLIQIGSY